MNKEELQQSYNIHWKAMAAAIDQMMGQTIATSTGFQLLSKEVLRRTGKTISPSTLKRLYGYIHEQVEPRESTLDVLVLFVGYGNWARFCQMQEMPSYSGRSTFGSGSGLHWRNWCSCTLFHWQNLRCSIRSNRSLRHLTNH